MKDDFIGLRVPSELRQKLEALASADRRTLSEKICMILESHLKRGGK